MDCLKSFSLLISGTQNATAGPPAQIDTWQIGTQHFFLYRSANTSPSTFTIQGFKNIDIYRIEAVGNMESFIGTTACIVQDWTASVQITGTNGQIGGVVGTPNGFNLSQQSVSPQFALSKFAPAINFASPINSATVFTLVNINMQGIAPENLTTLGIGWNINFNVFYKFEGE